MPEQERSLTTKVKRAVSSNPGEHILSVLKAGLATTPFCGGIASLMNDYIPSGKIHRLEQFAERLSEDLNRLKDRVDENIILTDEFAFIFEKCFRGVAENYQSEKLESFRNILVNSAIGTNLSEDEKEFFLNLVTTLSVLHIRVLKFMAHPLQYLEMQGIPADQIRGDFSQFFLIAMPDVDLEVIKSAFGDLHQYGFINTDKTVFSAMTSGQGLGLLGNRVSELGRRFIEFCSRPN
ncbi:MAG: hypothetical protein JRC90_02265 [Deltaproteobacteria bacterium]|nr:hypothetical protein [Deltaproteobacteria bacterium]